MSKHLTYQSYIEKNKGRIITWFDYVHMVCHLEDIPDDFIFALINITSPKLIKIDDMLFLDNLFSYEKYKNEITHEKSKKQIQYWQNIMLITDLTESLSYENCIKMGEKLVEAWNNKIIAEYNTFQYGKAHLLLDEEEEEVAITIYK